MDRKSIPTSFPVTAPSRIMKRVVSSLLLCFAFLAGCTQEPASPLQVATNLWIGYEPLYLARSLGYFNESSIRLNEMPSTSDVIKAFRNGVIDVAALTLDEALLLLQDGFDGKIILVTDISNGADVVIAHPHVANLKGLRGKKVGVESLALGAYMLSRALEKGGLKPDDVTMVPLKIDEHEAAYHSGKVDAVVTFEPVRTKLLSKGAHIIFDSSMIPNEISDVLVVRADAYHKKQEAVHTLEQGWFKALDYLRTNPDDACRIMSKREGISAAEFRNALKGIIIPGREENRQLLARDLLPAARRLSDIMFREKLLRKAVDPTHLLEQSHTGSMPK